MKEFNYVPMFRPGLNELTDGIEIKASNFCKKNCIKNVKCQQHYQRLFHEQDGNYVCPYGFASTLFSDDNEEKYIFTGMRLIGTYVPKLADKKVKESISRENAAVGCFNNRKITDHELKTYMDYFLEYKYGVESHDELKNFVENIFHDIRKFNGQLKVKGNRLYNKANSGGKGAGQFLELAQNIQAICAYMSLRLNAYDFTYNEELLAATEPISFNMYHIFDKVKHCLSDRASERNLKIEIVCNGQCGDIRAYDCLELLPYILLDNAIKYADNKSKIKVEIVDSPHCCKFSVSSQTAPLKAGESEHIFKRGFRGENAKRITPDGAGIGLYTAKKICDIHNGTISVREVYDSQKKVNNFVIDIELMKAYNI